MRKCCGIYKIENIINGKVYIGQSVDIKSRKRRHYNELKKGIHINIHLQRAFDKYGEDNFKHSIIEECSKEDLDEKERFWIGKYGSNDYRYGYNQDSGGQENKKMNEDVKRRIGKSREYPLGCETANSLLSEEEVIDIKYMLIEGYDVSSIADKYEAENRTIYNIRHLKTYTNVAEEINEVIYAMYNSDNYLLKFDTEQLVLEAEVKNKSKTNNKKISNSEKIKEVEEIKKYLYDNKVSSFRDVSNILNTKDYIISNIARCRTYEYILPQYNELLKKRYGDLKLEKHLSVDEVKKIKHYLSLGDKNITNKFLAEKYEVDASNISNIKLLKAYKDVAPEYNEELVRLYGNFKKGKILTENEVAEIKKLLVGGHNYTHRQLGDMFEVDSSQISRIKNLKIFSEYGKSYNEKLIEKFSIHKN